MDGKEDMERTSCLGRWGAAALPAAVARRMSPFGKDAFHRVPDFPRNEWDAVERVLTIPEHTNAPASGNTHK
jgi:hypothetical protein